MPDAPLYVMYPKVVGANATPIAFAEVYLALQSKTVDAQENPLPTIEAKKFYEVQSHINLTGHITEMLLTIVSGQTWGKLSDADKKTFEMVFKEAAAKATDEIAASETKLVDDFATKYKKTVVKSDRVAFAKAFEKFHLGPRRHLGQGDCTTGCRPSSRRTVAARRRGRDEPRAACACGSARADRHCQETRRWTSTPAQGDGRRRRVPRHRRGGGPVAHHRSRLGRARHLLGARRASCSTSSSPATCSTTRPSWTEEIARYLLIGTVFVGAAIGVAKNNHIQVDLLYRYLPRRGGARAVDAWSTCCASPSSPRWWC